MPSLIDEQTTIKVSSVLDRSVGKKYLVDGSPETCWTSAQGLPQYILLSFAHHIIPKAVALTFQGGFVGTRCRIEYRSEIHQEWQTLKTIYPEDVNRRQTFDLTMEGGVANTAPELNGLKFVFEESSDFFGRITVYDLQLS